MFSINSKGKCFRGFSGLLVSIQNGCIMQAAIRPPTFVFFVNDAKLFSDTYRRYMEKQLRTDAGFAGTPIRLLWRSRKRSDKNGGGTEFLAQNCNSF